MGPPNLKLNEISHRSLLATRGSLSWTWDGPVFCETQSPISWPTTGSVVVAQYLAGYRKTGPLTSPHSAEFVLGIFLSPKVLNQSIHQLLIRWEATNPVGSLLT